MNAIKDRLYFLFTVIIVLSVVGTSYLVSERNEQLVSELHQSQHDLEDALKDCLKETP